MVGQALLAPFGFFSLYQMKVSRALVRHSLVIINERFKALVRVLDFLNAKTSLLYYLLNISIKMAVARKVLCYRGKNVLDYTNEKIR